MSDLFASLQVNGDPNHLSEYLDDATGVFVIEESRLMVDQERIVELKTRSEMSTFIPAEVYDQVFFSQTPHLFVGRHRRGVFYEVKDHKLEDMTSEKNGVESGMRKVGLVLHELKRLASQFTDKHRLMSLICQDGVLVLRARNGGISLPSGLRDYFE